MKNSSKLKNQIHRACIDQLEERIARLEKRVASIEESKKAEMGSTIGEVFESGKTMIQMDGQKFRQQLNLNRSQLVQLQQIIHENNSDVVRNGSLVETTNGLYYIAIGLGEMVVGGQKYYAVSEDAPAGKALIGKKVDDEVIVEQGKMTILGIH